MPAGSYIAYLPRLASRHRHGDSTLAYEGIPSTLKSQPWLVNATRSFATGGQDTGNGFGVRDGVDFGHLNFDLELVKHLNLFGIRALKPFQYIMGRCLLDALGSMEASPGKAMASKFVFHNDAGSGRSLGYILPLLQAHKGRHSSLGMPGSTLIVVKDEEASRSLGSLILALNPQLDCLVLDDVDESVMRGTGETIRGDIGGGKTSPAIHKFAARKELSGSKIAHSVLVVSVSRLRSLLVSKSAGFSQARLSAISCVVFDDLSRYLPLSSVVGDAYRRIRAAKLALATGRALGTTGETGRNKKGRDITPRDGNATVTKTQQNDVHIVCVVDSVGEAFCKCAAEHLGGFWLYDFRNGKKTIDHGNHVRPGTKQRLVGDGRTDAVRLEVDLESPPEIISLANGEAPGDANLPIEHSICKVAGGKSKWERIYALKCLVHHYLNLPTFTLQRVLPPMIKRPRAAHQCIIFVANRSQQRHLCALECFRDLCARLGSDLNVHERAANLNSFRNGSRPILVATDASVAGCNFDDVRYIFNYHPPPTADAYRARASIAGKNSNSLCITLYSREQYSAFSSLLKTLGKRVSIHMPPTKDYMLRFNVAWLERFAAELVELKPGFLAPFQAKAEELLRTHDRDALFGKTLALLLGEDSVRDGSTALHDCSLLSGRRGFTAVTVFDGGSDFAMSVDDLRRLVQRLLPLSAVDSVLGKYAKTESGYVVDVASPHVGALLAAAAHEPNVCFEAARQLPRMLLGPALGGAKARGHMSKLPWRRYKIRRLQLQKRMV
ncbi:ATP-dependent RNA helicase, putative [Babesia caballi]|uniref:ATP-dependent RNA helicase n=1 Tax=Babesia caballi TaxID=5871 RepID=A0AAV4LRP1_BABCB|nr:ATP-dependent RNA helicase, putative [Babesia caballi]